MNALTARGATVLVVDDEPGICRALAGFLEAEGHRTVVAASVGEALRLAEQNRPDVAFVDLRLPDGDGLALLDELKLSRPELQVVLITAFGGADVAIRATLAQAYAYLPKPFDLEAAGAIVRRAVSRPEIAIEAADVSAWRPGEWVLCGSSEPVLRLRRRIAEVSSLPAPVLFAGEVGSGREAAALVLHDRVVGASRPFRTVRCATARSGEVVAALRAIAGGDPAFWLFADLEELDPAEVDPTHWREASARSAGPPTVAATVSTGAGSDTRSTILAGRWPGWSVVQVPPLARRREDLRALVSALLGRLNHEEARGVRGLDSASLAEIERRYWPGNLRELTNVLRAAVLRSRGAVVTADALASERPGTSSPPGPP